MTTLLAVVLLALAAGGQEPPRVASVPDAPDAKPRDAAEDAAEDDDLEALAEVEGEAPPDRFERWLEEVEVLITSQERALFQRLDKDYQRRAFIDEFWRYRDPYPETPRNELKERWPIRLAEAKSRYDSLTDDRARVLMVHGPPAGSVDIRCTRKYVPAELWIYQGSEHSDQTVLLIFIRLGFSAGESRVWNPNQGSLVIEQVLNRARNCINGVRLQEAVALVSNAGDSYANALRRFLAKPRPRSIEWVNTFVADSTDVDPDVERFEARLDLQFLGRHQHRTVTQGLVAVPIEEAGIGEYAGYRSHDFLLTGEVLIDDTLFERFRYKFGTPEMRAPGILPLSFQRYLRPGSYTLIVKVEDLNSGRMFRDQRDVTVPRLGNTIDVPTFKDPRTEELFAEATAAIAAGETGIRIMPPLGELHTGFRRFDTLVSGDEIEKVRFYLDDQLVLTKNRAPFNVEIDLGSYPDLHALRAEALDGDGVEVASDEILVNSGGYRFDLKLVEPRAGRPYVRSLRAQAEIEAPEGRSIERVEFYLNETLAATLYQEPWVQPLVLPEDGAIAYVRAVAYLPDGNSTEDLVFINAPDYLEELEIQFVELYTTVLDREGRPVEGLREVDFTVFEDGVRQSIARFERVEDLPIHVGILIDNSASMVGTLGEVRKAALSFFQQAVTAKDRAAVITFNSFPHLAVELTNDRTALGSGLAGLVPEGQTALYDSVMFALYYFTGIKGQRAILVLSDGRDESSRFDFEQTLEYARRAGITIYSIGFRLGADIGARQKLSRLADETGGRSFFIRDITELKEIYGQIQRELRSQYLIAYQSSNTSQEEEFRSVDLKVGRNDLEVKTLSGYYP